mgnify:CR=1 FL=1
MATVIAFANQKGGVGKTTLSVLCACWLAQFARKKVLYIDFDAQGSATNVLVGRDKMTSSRSEVLLETDPGEIKVQKVDLKAPLPIYRKRIDNDAAFESASIDLIGSFSGDAKGYDTEALPLASIANPAKHLAKLKKNYDYVVIDCPPSLGRRLSAALCAADQVICPIKLSGQAIDGLGNLFRTILGIRQRINPKLNILGVVINEFSTGATHAESLENLRQDKVMGRLLFKTKIRRNAPTDTAMTRGLPIWALPSAFKALDEFSELMREMLKRIK